MLKTYPAFLPCSATNQNSLPICPSPTGIRRGFPLLRPVVSSNAYPGSGRPIASGGTLDTEKIAQIVGHAGERNGPVYKITVSRGVRIRHSTQATPTQIADLVFLYWTGLDCP